MFVSLRRVFQFAFLDFYRNRGISLAAVFVLVITILLATGIFFVHGMSNFLVSVLQDKIDVAAYFKAETEEEDIFAARDEIMAEIPGIRKIDYISREDALVAFKEKHKGDEVVSQALLEVGDNPFLPSLNITTEQNDVFHYEKISQILQGERYAGIIEKVDFSEKQDTIKKVFSITQGINRFGIGLGTILILVAVLVVFNTVKLGINNSKEEINTMKVVGATNWFIKMPFIIEGILFGLISFVICMGITILSVYFLAPSIEVIMPGFNLLAYFMDNLLLIIGIQLGTGVGLGAIASSLGVKKYLKA